MWRTVTLAYCYKHKLVHLPCLHNEPKEITQAIAALHLSKKILGPRAAPHTVAVVQLHSLMYFSKFKGLVGPQKELEVNPPSVTHRGLTPKLFGVSRNEWLDCILHTLSVVIAEILHTFDSALNYRFAVRKYNFGCQWTSQTRNDVIIRLAASNVVSFSIESFFKTVYKVIRYFRWE